LLEKLWAVYRVKSVSEEVGENLSTSLAKRKKKVDESKIWM
jgi:hypothetical protein